MLVNLLINEAIIYMKLSHFKEAVKCCNDALRLTKQSADVFYRKSQALTYNKCSNFEMLEQALSDINTAIQMRPNQENYKKHKEILENTIKGKTEYEQKQIEWILKVSINRYEKGVADNKQNFQIIPVKQEKTFELKVLKQYFCKTIIILQKNEEKICIYITFL